MTGYVYIIASNSNGPVKIGHSKDPQKRLKQLQTGHSDKLSLYHMEEFDGLEKAKLFEKIIHKNINYQNRSGEWFNLTVDKAKNQLIHAVIYYGEMSERQLKEHV